MLASALVGGLRPGAKCSSPKVSATNAPRRPHDLIAGLIASKLVNRHGEGFLLDIALGVVGAMVALDHGRSRRPGVNGFNLYSMLVGIGGALGILSGDQSPDGPARE